MDGAAKREHYDQWKTLIPVLYDSFTSHCLIWPSLSCRWGPVIESHTYKTKQRVYLSEQTDGSVPNTLVVATADVIKPHVAAGEPMSSFTYEGRSPLVKKQKTIIHPGEVNRIRECPQHPHIVATHTDSPEVLIWNVESQPNRAQDSKTTNPKASKPDIVLVGHEDIAPFALALSPAAPRVISGGKDNNVLLWSLEDEMTTLLGKGAAGGGGAAPPPTDGGERNLKPRGVFKGHSGTIEDVCFRPSSCDEFASAGDDRGLLFWDARVGQGEPVAKVAEAHKDDVHCVDWNALDEALVLTGSADNFVKLFDRRKLGAAVHTFKGHDDVITCVQWNPHQATIFGSAGEDSYLKVWDTSKIGGEGVPLGGRKKGGPPPELLFQHAGHQQKVVEFHWNPNDPWVVLSVSDENTDEGIGGSIVQVWRMNDLIYLSEEEALGELSKHREAIGGRPPKPQEEKAVHSSPGAKRKKDDAEEEPPPRPKDKVPKAAATETPPPATEKEQAETTQAKPSPSPEAPPPAAEGGGAPAEEEEEKVAEEGSVKVPEGGEGKEAALEALGVPKDPYDEVMGEAEQEEGVGGGEAGGEMKRVIEDDDHSGDEGGKEEAPPPEGESNGVVLDGTGGGEGTGTAPEETGGEAGGEESEGDKGGGVEAMEEEEPVVAGAEESKDDNLVAEDQPEGIKEGAASDEQGKDLDKFLEGMDVGGVGEVGEEQRDAT